MELKDTVPLLSGLVGGIVGAAMNSLLNRPNKSEAAAARHK